MCPFNCLKRRKLEEQGDKYLSDARSLFNNREAELSPSRRQPAKDLLTRAEDFKASLRETHMFKRNTVAKLYAESAREALHKIEGWLGPQAVAIDLGPLNRPTNSR